MHKNLIAHVPSLYNIPHSEGRNQRYDSLHEHALLAGSSRLTYLFTTPELHNQIGATVANLHLGHLAISHIQRNTNLEAAVASSLQKSRIRSLGPPRRIVFIQSTCVHSKPPFGPLHSSVSIYAEFLSITPRVVPTRPFQSFAPAALFSKSSFPQQAS